MVTWIQRLLSGENLEIEFVRFSAALIVLEVYSHMPHETHSFMRLLLGTFHLPCCYCKQEAGISTLAAISVPFRFVLIDSWVKGKNVLFGNLCVGGEAEFLIAPNAYSLQESHFYLTIFKNQFHSGTSVSLLPI